MPAIIDFLTIQQFSFFSTLTPEECAFVSSFLKTEFFEPGENINQDNDVPGRMFFVLKGGVRIARIHEVIFGTSGLEDWQEKELFEVYGAGSFFGQEMLFAENKKEIDWICLEEKTTLLSLSDGGLQQIQAESAVVGAKILRSLCVALQRSRKRYGEYFLAGLESKKNLGRMVIEKKKIKAMHRIAGSTSQSSVQQTLDIILASCIDCLQIEKGSIMIFDRGRLRVEAAVGKNRENILGQEKHVDNHSVSGRCFISRKPVFLQDIAAEEGLKVSPDQSQYGNNSLISMPLVSHNGESIGVLNVSKISSEVFTEKDLEILQDLTLEASAALGHEISLARLYRSFQDTFVQVKHVQKGLDDVEEKICGILQNSWPSFHGS